MSLNVAWMAYERGKAHLVISEHAIRDDHRGTAICGAVVHRESPYGARCANCLDTLNDLVEVASVDPPKRIRERITLTITRNAEGDPTPELIKRKLKPYTSIVIDSIEVEDLGPAREAE